jgi:hypothetical protein
MDKEIDRSYIFSGLEGGFWDNIKIEKKKKFILLGSEHHNNNMKMVIRFSSNKIMRMIYLNPQKFLLIQFLNLSLYINIIWYYQENALAKKISHKKQYSTPRSIYCIKIIFFQNNQKQHFIIWRLANVIFKFGVMIRACLNEFSKSVF